MPIRSGCDVQAVGVGLGEEPVDLASRDSPITATGDHDVSEYTFVAELLDRRRREMDPLRELTRR
jgi:hypothetical protein